MGGPIEWQNTLLGCLTDHLLAAGLPGWLDGWLDCRLAGWLGTACTKHACALSGRVDLGIACQAAIQCAQAIAALCPVTARRGDVRGCHSGWQPGPHAQPLVRPKLLLPHHQASRPAGRGWAGQGRRCQQCLCASIAPPPLQLLHHKASRGAAGRAGGECQQCSACGTASILQSAANLLPPLHGVTGFSSFTAPT